MSYRITWKQGNGYRCSCCRSTWECSEDFDSEVEAMDFFNSKKAVKNNPTEEQIKNDEDDVSDFKLIVIYEERELEL